ncbi:polysaccharide deacetylase family protein [Chloroflexota bacterium]
MYHGVSHEDPLDIRAVRRDRFYKQMTWLKIYGYQVTTLSDMFSGEQTGPIVNARKPIALTFDDGYLDTYTTAWPVLREFDISASIFLVSGWVGNTSAWREGSLANTALMSWENVREMAAGWIQFGSHTVTHPHLNKLESRDIEREVQDSHHQIKDQLEQSITHFSYPYSSTNPSVYYALRKAGYTHACTYRDHYVGGTGHSPLALQRIIVLSTDILDDFAAKVRSNFRLRLRWYRVQLIKSFRRMV